MKLLNPCIPPQTIPAERLQGLVLDWAGTTVDFGSLAPARTMQQVFSRRHIPLSDAEARQHMGLPKKEHIRGILSIDSVSGQWRESTGRAPNDSDVDEMYAEFIPLQFSCLKEYSAVIPGVAGIVESFRRRGLKIGSTTGYTRAMLDLLVESAANEGYTPDCSLTPEQAGSGRPHPFMMYECAIRLQIYPFAAIAKIGDTPADIHEGLNAGAWSIGIAGTGNAIGLSREDFHGLPDVERELLLIQARTELQNAGAHYVVDSLTDVTPVLDDIDARLEAACSLAGGKETCLHA